MVIVIAVGSIILVAVVTTLLGRWMQRKGRELERGPGDDAP